MGDTFPSGRQGIERSSSSPRTVLSLALVLHGLSDSVQRDKQLLGCKEAVAFSFLFCFLLPFFICPFPPLNLLPFFLISSSPIPAPFPSFSSLPKQFNPKLIIWGWARYVSTLGGVGIDWGERRKSTMAQSGVWYPEVESWSQAKWGEHPWGGGGKQQQVRLSPYE